MKDRDLVDLDLHRQAGLTTLARFHLVVTKDSQEEKNTQPSREILTSHLKGVGHRCDDGSHVLSSRRGKVIKDPFRPQRSEEMRRPGKPPILGMAAVHNQHDGTIWADTGTGFKGRARYLQCINQDASCDGGDQNNAGKVLQTADAATIHIKAGSRATLTITKRPQGCRQLTQGIGLTC